MPTFAVMAAKWPACGDHGVAAVDALEDWIGTSFAAVVAARPVAVEPMDCCPLLRQFLHPGVKNRIVAAQKWRYNWRL